MIKARKDYVNLMIEQAEFAIKYNPNRNTVHTYEQHIQLYQNQLKRCDNRIAELESLLVKKSNISWTSKYKYTE